MGNCLVLQEKVVRMIKTDRKILEYKHPTKVDQVLSQFSHHAIPDKPSVVNHLNTVNFPDDVLQEAGRETGVVRIKLVIRKQELQAMLSKGGVLIDDMIHKVGKGESTNKTVCYHENEVLSKGWSPALESIPEID